MIHSIPGMELQLNFHPPESNPPGLYTIESRLHIWNIIRHLQNLDVWHDDRLEILFFSYFLFPNFSFLLSFKARLQHRLIDLFKNLSWKFKSLTFNLNYYTLKKQKIKIMRNTERKKKTDLWFRVGMMVSRECVKNEFILCNLLISFP